MPRKTPPHEEHPQWTKARFDQFIRSSLRSAWNRWPPKYELLSSNRREVSGKRYKYEHQCAECKKWFQQKDIQIDHIDPIGSSKDWNEIISRMFVGVSKLQKLCKECHVTKTKRERSNG